ncbi:hypothetical protein ACLB1O_08320 [Escherichia coli]
MPASGADIVAICSGADALNEALDSYQQVLLTHYGRPDTARTGLIMTAKKRITRY